MLYQPVEAFLPLVIDKAEGIRESHTEMVQGDDLEEGERLVVGLVSVVI